MLPPRGAQLGHRGITWEKAVRNQGIVADTLILEYLDVEQVGAVPPPLLRHCRFPRLRSRRRAFRGHKVVHAWAVGKFDIGRVHWFIVRLEMLLADSGADRGCRRPPFPRGGVDPPTRFARRPAG